MRAERDEMPDYLRPTKKKSHGRLIIITAAISAIAWGLAMTYGKPIVIDVAKLKESIYFGGKPVFDQIQRPVQQTPAPIQEASYTAQSKPQNHTAILENIEVRQQKQNVFNDQNYQPQGANNTSPFMPAKPKQDGVKIVVIKEEPRLRDQCNKMYKPGSIELRECRMRADLGERNGNYSGNRNR